MCGAADERPGRSRPPAGRSRAPRRPGAARRGRARAGPRALAHRPDPRGPFRLLAGGPAGWAGGGVRGGGGAALWPPDRIAAAFAVFERALDEVDRQRDPDLYELLLAEL